MNPRAIGIDERPFVLVWEVTQACALTCDHCRADAQERRHPDELTTEEGEALLDEAARFGDDQLVVFSGGDPLTRDDVEHLVSYGVDQGLQITLTPSGTASLTSDRLDALADAGLRRMALSIDGATPESHDEFRGEPGSLRETIRAARHASDAGIPLQVNTTVCARTVDELPAIRELVADLGAVLWSVFFLVPVGRGELLDPISLERSDSVMKWLLDVADEASFGVKSTEAPQYRRVAAQRRRGEDGTATPTADEIGRRTGVRAGAGFAFVSHLGELYPSGFLPVSVGNVRGESLVERYRHSSLFESLRDPDSFTGKCGACPYRYVCGGSRSRAYAHTGSPLASDPLCPYIPEEYDGPAPDAWTDEQSERVSEGTF